MATLHRWIGYALFAWGMLYLNVGGPGEWAVLYDLPTLGIMLSAVAAAALVGLERDTWKALGAWLLRDGETPEAVDALERFCGLATYASWAAVPFACASGAIMMMKATDEGNIKPVSWWTAGGALCLLPIVYGAVLALFFHAHRSRARRWLARRGWQNPAK